MSEPAFYDDLDATRAEALRLFAAGVGDRRSPFHTPTLATIGLSNAHPRLRTVVLRAFEAERPSLRFHTDRRSQKIAEIRANPQVAVHGYDPAAKIQIRIEGWARQHVDDAVADAAWAGSRLMSRQCYGTEPGPGSAIAEGGAFTLPEPTAEETARGREHFCAVTVEIGSLEWLYLAQSGHRRAHFDWTGDGWFGRWLAP
jgi:hypothetical protein